MTGPDLFGADSLGALHVALVAAIVGYLVFCVSHAWATWRKRHARDGDRTIGRWAGALLWIGLASTLGGWLNRELEWREGVISGADVFSVRADDMASPLVMGRAQVNASAPLVKFIGGRLAERRAELVGVIGEARGTLQALRLAPLEPDPTLAARQARFADDDRARSSLLGFASGASVDVEAARSVRERAALDRVDRLYVDGFSTKAQYEQALAASRIANGELRRRRDLHMATIAADEKLASADLAIKQDRGRAIAARDAKIDQAESRLSAATSSLAALDARIVTRAPFAGTIVYRHPAPALARAGDVIVAVARGPGFLARVNVPERDTDYLVLGQELTLKLGRALVDQRLTGRLRGIDVLPDSTGRRVLEILCKLPPEQFNSLTSDAVRVSLTWRPPIYREPLVGVGLAMLLGSLLLAIAGRRSTPQESEPVVTIPDWRAGWWLTQKEDEVFNLGVRFGEELASGRVSNATIGAIEVLIERQPTTGPAILSAGVLVTYVGIPTLDSIEVEQPARLRRVVEILELKGDAAVVRPSCVTL